MFAGEKPVEETKTRCTHIVQATSNKRARETTREEPIERDWIQSFWHVSVAPRQRATPPRRVHVTPNNKVARFSTGWLAVNIVGGH